MSADHHQPLHDALERLSPRERQVITMRWGLQDEPPLTVEEVAHRLGRPRDQVRAIEDGVLARLSQDPLLANGRVTAPPEEEPLITLPERRRRPWLAALLILALAALVARVRSRHR